MIKNSIITFARPFSEGTLDTRLFPPAILTFQKETGTLHIRIDRFGTKHIYYAYDGKRVAIGTSFKEVSDAASSKKLDWLGIGGFFRFGFFPDDRTYYEDVRILKPATEYVFDENGKLLSCERYWNWKYEPNDKRSYADTVDEFARIFHAVIQEQTAKGRIAVPISGGLDSRSTVVALMAQRTADSGQKAAKAQERFWGYSYGYSDDSIETKIAAQIAKVAGLAFNRYTIKPYLFQKMDSIMHALEGFQDITQARQAFVTAEIASHADSVICAHWGDVWMDRMLKGRTKDKGLRTKDELTEIIFGKFKKKGSDELIALFSEQIPRDLDDQLKQMIHDNLRHYDQIKDDDFKIKAYKTDHWSFRWTLASIRMFEAAAKPLLPFYDDRIADFFMTVPTGYVAGRKLQIDYIKKYAPSLARVTWQAYDADLYHYQNFNTWEIPKRLLKKAARVLSRKKTLQRNWEAQFLSGEGRSGLERWLANSCLKIQEFVSVEKIGQEIDGLFSDVEENKRGYLLSLLLTFSVCHEKLKKKTLCD